MSDTILCPVCETENDPAAINCEVCGERLAPLAPGEELSPEENVAATLASAEQEGFDMGMPELPDSEADDAMPSFASVAATEEGLPEADSELGMTEASEGHVTGPDVLYSSLDGTAFERGTPEYEEGFGPMGEELVATPPQQSEASPDTLDHDDEDSHADAVDEAPSTEAAGFEEEVYPPSSNLRASAAFAAAFPVRQKPRPAAHPLPQPGVHAAPATLTLYVNRQPVHTHSIETDETLIGRRDPMADAYPDIDLTEWDEAAHVSRKHAYVYRQNRNYQLYVVSNAGTQLNSDLLTLGERRSLKSGDVLVIAGRFAMKFELPAE
ncbi:MAG: FHA domain-containing protein [bacterium]